MLGAEHEKSGEDIKPFPVAFFDSERRAASVWLKGELSAFAKEVEKLEADAGLRVKQRGPGGRQKFAVALEAIVCNFLVVNLLDPRRALAIPLSNGMMSSGAEAYGCHFTDAIEVLCSPSAGFLERVEKGSRYTPNGPRRTTFRLLHPLISRFSQGKTISLADVRMAPNRRCLVLKGLKDSNGESYAVPFCETIKTSKLNKQVLELNSWLAAAPIIIDHTAIREINADSEILFDPTKRSVRRIFNNASWMEGGRLFDGFWETMRRADRFRHIRIGTKAHPKGEPIANVDYGQLFPRLAYLRARAPAPVGDLYDVFGDGRLRSGVKKLCNAMLFAKGPLKNWPADTSKLFAGMQLREAVDAIKKRHGPIAHLFGTAIGYSLMFMESNVLMDALYELKHLGIYALPLHDSVLVARSDAAIAMEVLERRLGSLMPNGPAAVVTIDYGD